MFGAIAGGIASALAGGAMSKLFGGGQKAASGGIQGDVLATDNNTVGMRSEERRVGKECRSGWSPDQEKIKNLLDVLRRHDRDRTVSARAIEGHVDGTRRVQDYRP